MNLFGICTIYTIYNAYRDFWSMTKDMNSMTKCMHTPLNCVHTKCHTSKINDGSVINSKKGLLQYLKVSNIFYTEK